jgi:hypothetical protein
VMAPEHDGSPIDLALRALLAHGFWPSRGGGVRVLPMASVMGLRSAPNTSPSAVVRGGAG